MEAPHHLFGAIDIKTGRLVKPDVATRGAYTCPSCDQPVHLKCGKIRRPHFAHNPGSDCSHYGGGGESAVHVAAKHQLAQYLKDGVPIAIYSKCQHGHSDLLHKVVYQEGDKVNIEQKLEGRCRADVGMESANGSLRYVFEVFHTHATSKSRPEPWFEFKALDILARGQAAVELYCCRERGQNRTTPVAAPINGQRAANEALRAAYIKRQEEAKRLQLMAKREMEEERKRVEHEQQKALQAEKRDRRLATQQRFTQFFQPGSTAEQRRFERISKQVPVFKQALMCRRAAIGACDSPCPEDIYEVDGVAVDKIVYELSNRLLSRYMAFMLDLPSSFATSSCGWWNKLRDSDRDSRIALICSVCDELNVVECVSDAQRMAVAAHYRQLSAAMSSNQT